ncbi:MAG TPA: HipA domain-containing protein [Pseudobdellovibrionaceae bacterium]|jgi:serine/threonine-protein kinase HipA
MGLFGKKMGLEMAVPMLLDMGGVNAYLIERYDRKKVRNQITRLHQEDFCQALAYSHKVKYEKDGGPGFQECYQCAEELSSNLPEDLERLVKWLIFNVIVGNCDAHAKNISFLMVEPNEWRVSPHYDIVSTKIYPNLSTKLAMTIGGSSDSGTITGSHWTRLAKDIKVGTKWLHLTVQEMAEKSVGIFKETCHEFSEAYGKSSVLSELEKVILSQQRRLLSQLKK